ncbi:MAG: hypothetical protein Ctma_0024 [Catillopecten margaritatus gill symbiont]|uniref:Cadherin domain-containing protein n=1 Tax=Catillopecten margaritatus gill symbiont TaxID=3083288 RepID=A0AAU6PEC1_9GAMM
MKTLLKNACSTNYNATNLITHVAWVGGAHSRALSRLKHFLAFGALTLSLNVTSGGEINQFDKEAYLNLGQQYSDNNTQVAVKEENTIDTLLKEIGSSVRNALGGTDSDNANQLGKKITDNLKNKANNTVINKTEGFINQKANELANSIGNGRTEISVHKLESNNPTYSLKTIQPLTELNTDSTELTFIQAQINSGENHGERRDTINLGLGQRYLLEGGQSIAGINLFTDYETESKHKRASLGLEYQRANFSANINKYYPLSDKKVIGDYTEEPLAGHDIKLTGQVPYLSWAKIKGTHYYWDAKVGDNIKGTILGVEIELNPSTTLEIGTENSNTAERASYARLSAQLPFKDGEALTNFKVSDQAFANSNIVTLTNLDYVERSNKIRIEKLLNSPSGVSVVLGEYNALTVGSTCTLYNASNVAIANGSGVTGADGSVTLSNVVLPTGLISSSCNAIGTYIDEATGVTTTSSPVLRAAKIYSGTGSLTLLASPLSEIAYQLANAGTLASDITTKNTQIATAFGISGVDFTATIPTDLNTITAANDDAGKFGTVLAAVSQMSENAGHDDTQSTANNGGDNIHANETIQELVVDMADGDIDGIADGQGKTLNLNQAINNFKTGSGANNPTSDTGNTNAGNVDIVTTTPSVILNKTAVTLDENGVTTYTVVLNTQPTGSVTITPVSADTGAASVSGVMTFTTANWSTAQTVTVTGVADVNATDETVTISHTITGADYASVTSADMIATVVDFSISAQTRSIAENSANATNVGAVLVTTGSPTGFSITSGNTNTAFAISNSGQITVADVNQLDFETMTSYTLAVQITKADTKSQSANITVNVTNVNEGSASISAQTRSIAENSANATNVGAVLVTTGSPTGFSITSGNTNTAFAISNSGQITVADVNQLDFETTKSYTLAVQITKADTTSQSANITVNVTNVNEGSASISAQTRSIAENSANATNVGAVLVTTGSPTGFSITSGNTNTAFAISNSGQITVADANQLDFETTTSYTLAVQITKADTTSQSANITVNVTDVNEGSAVSISAQTRSIAENSANATNVGAVLVTTGSPTGFSITSGNTNTAFAISNSGQITVADANQLDFETTTSYTLAVQITKADTTSQSANITVNVTNVNEGSASISAQTRSIAENSANATNVGAVLVTTGSPTGFSITSGNTNTAFAISNSGQITVADVNQLDFETTTSYTLAVQITKADTTSQSANITVNVTNVNEGSASISAQTRSIAENSANATNVGAVLVTTGSPTGFSITSGNTNTAFAISNSGQITVADVNQLDFETTTSYTLAVQITKADTTSQSANITVNVTNVNEGSASISAQTRSIAENSANATNVGAVLVTTGSPTGFSITSGNTNTAFAISNSGQITVADVNQLDFETTTSYTLAVQITKADTTSQSANITVNVTNVNEGSAVSISAQTRSIAENSANATNVGAVLVTTGSPTGFSITSGNTNTAFAISNSGQITVADANQLDFETTTSYTLAVQITKADTTSQSANITVNVTDVVELASITIGTQTWSASNVSLVPTTNNVLGTDYWNAYVGTNGSGDTSDEDGYYYTWDAAMNVCPSGWSLPSDADWKVLEGQLGMSVANQEAEVWRGTDEGTKLKVGGSSGFEAKLAGVRSANGSFYDRGDSAHLWSSTESGSNAYRRALYTSNATVFRNTNNKADGFSVRCLKD